jgi:hypothetical protein
MYCPRCGESVEEGDRYCAACGATMPRKVAEPEAATAPKRSLRERLTGLIGRSRRERVITVVTVLALLIAVAAFIALDPSDEEGEASASLTLKQARVIDTACVGAKKQIAAAATSAQSSGDLAGYTSDLLLAIVEFRSTVRSLTAGEATAALDDALLTTAIDAGALARIAREQPAQAAAQVKKVDADTAAIESAIADLGLERCPGITIVPAPTSP